MIWTARITAVRVKSMEAITTSQLRQKFLDFFRAHNHAVIPGASVVPKEDPTALFTTAGMQPLVPYLLGREHPAGRRLADVQVCIRTTDIDEVGDSTHLTCFEMLGNWSLGDYFKEESIQLSWSFLTSPEWLGISPDRLSFTCFAGDELVPKDEESAAIWRSLGVPEERIFFYGRDDNWWGPAGKTGPCGPDTEIFYWTGEGEPQGEPATDARWVEIWNNVFMEFNKQEDGLYLPLEQKNVDTGMGLERTAAILGGQRTVYDTDAFQPVLAQIVSLGGSADDSHERSRRIIADHARAAVFMLADGVRPSNLDRGYVLRRLIRRAVRHGRLVGWSSSSLALVADKLIDLFSEAYPHLAAEREAVLTALREEEGRFGRTLQQGLREFEKLSGSLSPGATLEGRFIFRLYDTYGFPLEMTQELADERGLILDVAGFEQALLTHQERSRTATAGTFKSGLADHGEMTVKYHTATHLLHQALRTVLGEHVQQRGSNITPERLRFDFSHPERLTDEERRQVEELVNEQIAANLPVSVQEMPFTEAQQKGALAFFGERYPDVVTVYSVGDFSREVCTGPHVESTGRLGHFKIVKEESAGAGIRRIKALLE